MIKDDRYWGNAEIDGQIVQETVNQYGGTADFLPSGSSPYSGACTDTSVSASYTPCEVVLVFSKTTMYEQNGTATVGAPSKQETDTYDDYTTSGGLSPRGYHNLLQKQTTSNNAPTITEKWTYATNDTTDSSNDYVYHTVNKAKHHEIDDASGHVWQCSDTTYDEGVSGIKTPAAGLPTTVKTYPNCGNTSNANTTYTAYDLYGNTVGTVDAFGAANSGVYNNSGCTLATAPVVKSSAWTASRYTTCTVYDSYGAQATSETNALGQTNSIAFDDTQGRQATSSTGVVGQTTSVGYTIDTNKNPGLQVKNPGETGSYSTKSSSNSTCVFSSNRPCYEIDALSSQYANAITRTFYDAQGHETEKRKPLDATHDLITFTVYNEWNDSKFESQPFRVASGSSWIDPNGAIDDQGNAPTGMITITDVLGRTIATRDPLEGTPAELGITCGSGNVSGTWTTCVGFGLGSPDPNSSAQYDYRVDHDANNHMTVTFPDVLGRTRFVKTYSASGSINDNITGTLETQYNALDKQTAVIVTDAAPQSGQSVTSVTTTETYDDLGQQTSIVDPDRGTHIYAYDADGRQITDVSGSRTIGTSYDLLGRTRCIQDAAPTTNGSGACSSGSHPLIQNSYDTSFLQLSGTTNSITGRLGQSIATTYYPDGSSVTTTQQFEYDQRGNIIASNEQLNTPTAWDVTTALPTYQQQRSYNDNNQLTTTQTTVGGVAGSTYTQVYDSTSGMPTGLSNSTTGSANLATLAYNQQGLVSDINFLTTSGSNPVTLANDHFAFDGDQRPASTTATWQSGSGSSGTIFSSSRVYDPVGNVISGSNTQATIPGQIGSGGSETQNFCYNEQNELIWAGNAGTLLGAGSGTCGSATLANSLSGAGYTNTFAYTHLGQLWQAPLGGAGMPQQYLYCSSAHPHQLTGVFVSGATCSNQSGASYSASYDAWGNLISRTTGGTTSTLSYDALDHLTQWNAGSTNQEWYAYDASGNRVLRRNTNATGTSITTYTFGEEEHGYSATGSNQGNTYYYSLGNRLIGTFSGTTTQTTQFFLTDALGSVLATFSAAAGNAAVLGNQVYGPYGNQRYTGGTIGTAKGYTGQYNDSTGLDYYNARYYDPVIGEFLSADTKEGNLQGFNPYAYVRGNPETQNDPTGHCDAWCQGADVWMGVSEQVSPITKFSSDMALWGLTLSDAIDDRTPSPNEVARTRMKADIDGNLFTLGALAIVLGGAEFTIGSLTAAQSSIVYGLVGYAADTILQTELSTPISKLVDKFYELHPVVQPWNQNTGPQIRQHGYFVLPGLTAPSPSQASPTVTPGNNNIIVFPQNPGGGAGGNAGGGAGGNAGGMSYTVGSGDTLWGIASQFYGSGSLWQKIYGANQGTIGNNPNLIFAGEQLFLPD